MIVQLYDRLGGAVSVYTLEQRGTGRSSPLTCGNSPSSTPELTQCLRSLHVQYKGNFAAFSVTSAAFDLVTIISQTQASSDVVVYGLGFGTLVVERLLHFGIAPIKGYVLDSSATTSGAGEFAFASQSDAEFGVVSGNFLALCEKDEQCSAKFPAATGRSVSDSLREVLARIDTSSCGSLLHENDSKNDAVEPSSSRVRQALAALMQNATERALIPAVVYRLHRCNTADQQVLKVLSTQLKTRAQELASHHELVSDLQTFSELWEFESPTQSTLETRANTSLINPVRMIRQLRRFCVFTGDTTSTACAVFNSSSDSGNSSATVLRFTYARDKYWNVVTTIPAHASILLLSGKLDGQYPLRHAQLLADGMLGAAKKLVVFEIGTHNDILQSSASSDNSGRSLCRLEILGSYIQNRGTLDRLDASCLEKEPTTPDFRIAESVSLQLLGVMDAYASVTGNSSLSDAKNGSSSGGAGETFTFDERADLERSLKLYRAAFFVALGVLAIGALVAVVLLYRWWKSKQLHDEETQLRRMRGEEPDDLELLRHIYMSSPEFWGSTVGGQRARGRSWGGDLEGGKEESKSAQSDAADKSFSLD